MKNLFNLDSPVMAFLSRLADLIILNILWLICCIPIITIGASTTAMYRVTLNMAYSKGSGVVSSFWAAFKENFKQATVLFLILLLPTALILLYLWLLLSGAAAASLVLGASCMIAMLIYMLCISYVYPLTAQFVNTVKGTLHNAMLMSFGNFPLSLLIVILNLSPVILFFVSQTAFWYTCFLWPIIGSALIAYLNALIFKKVFKKYMPADAQAEQE